MNNLDTAFQITQKVGSVNHLEIKDKIQETFPDLEWEEIVELYSKAQDLLSEAEKFANKYREKEIEEPQAKESLISACPGFSEENYNNAWSHGLHVSMW